MRKIPDSTNPNVPPYDDEPQRIEARKFYNSTAWKKCRAAFIRENPNCSKCGTWKTLQVHHIKDRRNNPDDQFCFENLQVLCVACHMKERFKDN